MAPYLPLTPQCLDSHSARRSFKLRHPAQAPPFPSSEFLQGSPSRRTGSRCMPGDSSSGKNGTLASMRRQRETRIKRVAPGSIPVGSIPGMGPTVSTCHGSLPILSSHRLKQPHRSGAGSNHPGDRVMVHQCPSLCSQRGSLPVRKGGLHNPSSSKQLHHSSLLTGPPRVKAIVSPQAKR